MEATNPLPTPTTEGDAPPPPLSLALPSSIIKQSTISSATSTLERLRSLHAEREACTYFASSLLSHPLGATGTNEHTNNGDDDGNDVVQQQQLINKVRRLDPLHPSSLPGGVRDAWASLSKSARILNVLGGGYGGDEVMDDIDIDKPTTTNITAAMIEHELANEKRHENEEYTLSNNGQLSVACRTMALKCVVEREGELVTLLGKEFGSGSSNGDGGGDGMKVLERAQKEIQDSVLAHQHPDPNNNSSNVELLNSFYEKINQVKDYHSQNTVQDGRSGGAATTNQQQQLPSSSLLSSRLSGQKRKHGHPIADGYDIASLITTETSAVRSGEIYTPEELFGRYLDLVQIYECEVRNMRHAFAATSSSSSHGGEEKNEEDNSSNNNNSNIIIPSTVVSMLSYLDFLSILSKGLNTSIPESAKLSRDRRKYVRFLVDLQTYLIGFMQRTSPFLDVTTDVIDRAVALFDKEWSERGGVDGWECRLAEASMVSDSTQPSSDNNTNVNGGGEGSTSTTTTTTPVGIDLSKYATSSDLEKDVSGDELKSELARIGLKCGGTVSDRAARLFLTKDTPLDKLPAKVFAKKKGGGGGGAKKAKTDAVTTSDQKGVTSNITSESTIIADRRVDIARLEAIVTSLLDQLRPTLEATRRLIERRTTQTENERDQEIDEEINGTPMNDSDQPAKTQGGGNNDSDDEDEDDAPIYNPKNVPLGWDGKPIPYWLFKLHGLNHFYPCEICGNESYRGRRNFEKHFTESRHAYGMRCLGVPNTKHFHGVTKIADAQELWGKLRNVLEDNQFDVDQEEEYEDSHGNVVNRAQYEDLGRQGLL